MEILCGPFKFTSSFDSGNLGKVELVKSNETVGSFGTQGNSVEYEVNVWTNQDCSGTKYTNGNRTWFYFGINGGKPNAVLKLNVLNLNKQAKLFEQGMQPVVCCIPQKPKWERVKDRVVVLNDGIKDNSCGISFRQKLPHDTRSSTLFIAFTYPFSYANLTSWLNDVDSVYAYPSPMSDNQLLSTSDIYYSRETVCLSLDGRPVDLLTISSMDGILSDREEYLINLFPHRGHQQRCQKFSNKKIVFLSSRVHPGEVPAQFVMNGAIKFLLEAADPRARMLRRLFVFKLMPMLNPDGVYRGHYRTDPAGVNLNRVYLKPSPILHPTIYAARKLILYAHFAHDSPDHYEYEESVEEAPGTELSANYSESQSDAKIESENRLCAGCIDPSVNIVLAAAENVTQDEEPLLPRNNENLLIVPRGISPREDDDHQCTFESCDEDSIVDYQEAPKNSTQEVGCCSSVLSPSSSSASACSIALINEPHKIQTPSSKHVTRRRNFTTTGQGLPPHNTTSKRSHGYSILKASEMESGLYVYIDFHAHASKRGIFMYGNHFDDIAVQTECMLLPRLMALNCQHFDFSACNFTERLMTVRDRRDGSSREGSGRVAVLKLTGLIRSYTLECNYNTGRLVNHLIPRPDSYGRTDAIPHSTHHPPKFTPELFESVGRSLCESILDLTDLNPWPRLKSTEFRTLDGLRSFLQRRIQHTVDYSVPRRSASSVRPGPGGTLPQSGSVARGKSFSIPSSPLKQRRSLSKISIPSSSVASCSSGPLIAKRENRELLQERGSAVSAGWKASTKSSKASLEKPSGSQIMGKQRPKFSKSHSVPAIGQEDTELLPSSSSMDDGTLTRPLKSQTNKKKKKIVKGKNKKPKTFKRSESR